MKDARDDNEIAFMAAMSVMWTNLTAGLRKMHRPVEFTFSYQAGLQSYDRCRHCHGKAGVHPCGCWQDEDAEYECQQCSRPDGGRGVRVPYPCATVRELDRIEQELDSL